MRRALRIVSDWLMGMGMVNAVAGLLALVMNDPHAVVWFIFAALAFAFTALCVDWVEARW
jgi:uncharacterized membrane protein